MLRLSIVRISTLLNLDDPYNRRVLPGAVEFARLKDWQLTIHNVKRVDDITSAMKDADGLLLGIHNFEEEPALSRTPIPAVCWSGSLVDINWRRVTNDDFAIGQVAAEHLIDRGFRHFVFYNDSPDIWAIRRHDGFLGRLELDDLTAITLTKPKSDRNTELVEQLLAVPRPFGAMMAHDPSAIRFMAACREAGLRIPDDVAVLSVNNDDFVCDVCNPPLSSIPLQTHRIGYESAALLAKLLEKVPLAPWSIVIPPSEMVVRRSSDTLATSDPLVIEAIGFIREELASGIATKQVVKAMAVSRTTLDARFMQAVGRTVADEIRRERLERARHLLASTDLPMPDIALRCGFSSARQLGETFTHFVQQTPSAYRRFVQHKS